MSTLPERCDVVIIGGGVTGASIAYHLAKLGITDVALLERRQLTCGTTWHAAGLFSQLRPSKVLTELAKYSAELFGALEAETGQATGYKKTGGLGVAKNDARLEEFARTASMGSAFGVDISMISAGEVKERWPEMYVEDLTGGFFLPDDGQVDPVGLTMAFAKGARMRGAKVYENTTVEKVLVENGKAVGVRTAQGDIRADAVVLAGGLWSAEIARDAGATVPLHAAEHFYAVTEPMDVLTPGLPFVRVPDEYTYYKEDAGKLLFGCFEPKAKPWGMNGVPEDFCFDALPEDLDHFEPVMMQALTRVPALANAGIQTWFNGPEAFTPDDRYHLGETAEVKRLFVAAGFNSIGVQSSGGVGKVMAEWIRDGHEPGDIADLDVRRTMPFQGTRAYLHDRTVEVLGLLHAMHWPFRQYDTARGIRRSPFHHVWQAANACMGELGGWERPNWFAPQGVTPEYEYSYGRQNWWEYTRAECLATRDQVALFDQSSFTKFMVEGPRACAALNRICTANIDTAADRITYTQWLNTRGGIEADATITRLSEHQFMVVSTAHTQTRDLDWLRRHIPLEDAVVTDVTGQWPMLGLMGPNARALLQTLSPHSDLSNEGFPFGTSREIEIGYARVRVSRITYVGELGWEIYIPVEFAAYVLEQIQAKGAAFGLTNAGYHAIHSLRMEKGYRSWGHDIGIEDNPLEAGLGFTLAWDKPGGFIGREALVDLRGKPLSRRMVGVQLSDPNVLMYHDEPIWQGDQLVGGVTSAMYGHRAGQSLGLAYVRNAGGVTADWLHAGGFEVEVAGKRIPATLQLGPFYDPKNTRIKS